ncbi:hypothetical protein [Tepidimicrobium xylanilyticum]
MITREDLEGLISYMNQVETCIDEGKIGDALYLIDSLRNNIRDFLENKQIRVGDAVKVRDVEMDEETGGYWYRKFEDLIGQTGTVIKIWDNRKDGYIYEVEFDDEEAQKIVNQYGNLFKYEELEVL